MRVMKYGFLLVAFFSISIGLCHGNEGDFGMDKPTAIAVVDFSNYGPEVSKLVNISAGSFKKAAVLGLMNHGWKVTKITDDEVIGVRQDDFKARIVLANGNTKVKIYVAGPNIRQNWADNIRKQMVDALVLLSN